ncbi:MAG: zinc transporter ZntB [Marinobacterium sp.]
MEYQLKQPALLHALLLDGNGGATILENEQISRLSELDGEVWIHLDYTEKDSQTWLEEHSGLSPSAIDTLLADKVRPRITKLADELIIALRGINLNINSDPEDMVSIRLLLKQNHLISTRKRRLQSVTHMVEQLQQGKGPHTLSELITELADGLTERIGRLVEELDMRLESLEEQLEQQGSKNLREPLSEMRTTNARLKRYLGPQKEALTQLIATKSTLISDDHRASLFETNDHLTRHIEDLDMLRERASAAQDSIMTQLSEQLNERLYLLAIISGLFLPLGFLTGLLGVNLGGIPGAENDSAFFIFLAALSGTTGLLAYLLKRRGWL